MNPEFLHVGIAVLGLIASALSAWIASRINTAQLESKNELLQIKSELTADATKLSTELEVHKAEDNGNFQRVNEGLARIERRLDTRAIGE